VVVDNRAGGGTITGTDIAAKSPPDGYTLVGLSIIHTINPSVHAKLPYDLMRDLAPVTVMCASPFMLITHPGVPAKSLKEFIALAKAKPGTLAYGSSGTGGAQHLMAEMLVSHELTHGLQDQHYGLPTAPPPITDGQGDRAIARRALLAGDATLTSIAVLRGGHVEPAALTSAAEGLAGIPADLLHIELEAVAMGLPGSRIEDIAISGTSLESLPEVRFKLPKGLDVQFGLPDFIKKALKKQLLSFPAADKRECRLCGICRDACPPTAIEIKNSVLSVDNARCIRCWCCRELCPYDAMSVKKSLLLTLLSAIRKK